MKRREFLASVGAAGFTFSNGNISFSKVEASDLKNENSVIYLFLSGGITHIETFDPVPLAPVEIRSTTGAIETNVNGVLIGGLHKELAKRTDRAAIVRSYAHVDSNHRSAQHLNLTGHKVIGDANQKMPSFGSCSLYKFGPNSKDGLPNYVKLNSHPHTEAATLGQKYAGYEASPEGVGDLTLKISIDHLNRRRKMLDIIDSNSTIRQHDIAKDYAEMRGQAIDSLTGNIADIFKVETDKRYERFKGNRLGEDLLRAVRLVENGCKFVFLTTGGWDMHNSIEAGLNRIQVPLDLYVSRIMDVLNESGMDKNVLLVVTTEFGRTYKVNVNAGRDHWPRNIPLMMSCSQYDMGRIIGKSNSTANEIIESPFGPQDLTCTILNHIGIQKGDKWNGNDGRPHYFIEDTAKNILT